MIKNTDFSLEDQKRAFNKLIYEKKTKFNMIIFQDEITIDYSDIKNCLYCNKKILNKPIVSLVQLNTLFGRFCTKYCRDIFLNYHESIFSLSHFCKQIKLFPFSLLINGNEFMEFLNTIEYNNILNFKFKRIETGVLNIEIIVESNNSIEIKQFTLYIHEYKNKDDIKIKIKIKNTPDLSLHSIPDSSLHSIPDSSLHSIPDSLSIQCLHCNAKCDVKCNTKYDAKCNTKYDVKYKTIKTINNTHIGPFCDRYCKYSFSHYLYDSLQSNFYYSFYLPERILISSYLDMIKEKIKNYKNIYRGMDSIYLNNESINMSIICFSAY